MTTIIELLRIRQWTKNLFILLPLVFSGRFVNLFYCREVLITFMAFSLISSAAYIFNDILDCKKDRLHQGKSSRPIANGKVSIPFAACSCAVCLLAGCWILVVFARGLVLLGFLYILLQIFYNFVAKRFVIFDVLTLSLGFQIRIWIGALAIAVIPSLWLQLCVFVSALFLGFTKRQCEILTLKGLAVEHRGALSEYTRPLLDRLILICSALTIMFYCLYTISPEVTSRVGAQGLLYSTVFVIYGIFRYLYLAHVRKLSDDPAELLLTDRPLLLDILFWLVFVINAIYIHQPH